MVNLKVNLLDFTNLKTIQRERHGKQAGSEAMTVVHCGCVITVSKGKETGGTTLRV